MVGQSLWLLPAHLMRRGVSSRTTTLLQQEVRKLFGNEDTIPTVIFALRMDQQVFWNIAVPAIRHQCLTSSDACHRYLYSTPVGNKDFFRTYYPTIRSPANVRLLIIARNRLLCLLGRFAKCDVQSMRCMNVTCSHDNISPDISGCISSVAVFNR